LIPMSDRAPRITIDEYSLLEWGARIGAAARSDRDVERAQMENLIASLDAVEGREALLVVAAYAQRQAQRLKKEERAGRAMARMAGLVAQAMLDLYEKGGGKKEARVMLGFAKWVYEAFPENFIFRDVPERLKLTDIMKRIAEVARR
jgi:hypothetical protein